MVLSVLTKVVFSFNEKKPKPCIIVWYNTTGIWEQEENVENTAGECILHFSSVLKCPECFITV